MWYLSCVWTLISLSGAGLYLKWSLQGCFLLGELHSQQIHFVKWTSAQLAGSSGKILQNHAATSPSQNAKADAVTLSSPTLSLPQPSSQHVAHRATAPVWALQQLAPALLPWAPTRLQRITPAGTAQPAELVPLPAMKKIRRSSRC